MGQGGAHLNVAQSKPDETLPAESHSKHAKYLRKCANTAPAYVVKNPWHRFTYVHLPGLVCSPCEVQCKAQPCM